MNLMLGLFLIIVKSGANTDFMCPPTEQWKFRVQICLSSENYTCLWDEVNNNYTEQCNGPKLERKGNKLNINKGNLNRAECPTNSYQPVTFTTVGNSHCQLSKSDCTDIGQVKVDNGTSTTDVKCRCDYTCGYAPVANISDPCYCVPSLEDCSCFLEKCSTGKVLSPDYKCTTDLQFQDQYQCPFIQGLFAKHPMTGSRSNNKTEKNHHRTTDADFSIDKAWIGIIILIILYIVIAIVIHWKEKEVKLLIMRLIEAVQDFCKELEITVGLEENIYCIEGQSITLKCEVNKKKAHGKWFKDDHYISKGDRYEISACKLKINNAERVDTGTYQIKFKGEKISEAMLIVLEQVTEEEINFFRVKHLLETVAEPVVRLIFDREFNAEVLQKTLYLQKNGKLFHLRREKHISRADDNLLFPQIANFRAELKIIGRKCTDDLQNKDSACFQSLALSIKTSITKLYSSVKGVQEVEIIQFRPGSMIVTLDLTSKYYYNQKQLEKTLREAVEKGCLPPFRTSNEGFSFKFCRNTPVKVSSKDLKIRLMVILLKNLADRDISDNLPLQNDISENADLARIKFYRNVIAQNSLKTLSTEDFDKIWLSLRQAIGRLGGPERDKECEDIHRFNPTPKDCYKYFGTDPLQTESRSNSVDSMQDLKEFLLENLLRKAAKSAVQAIFDKEFPAGQLKASITERKKALSELKSKKEITQSQWEYLFPEEVIDSVVKKNHTIEGQMYHARKSTSKNVEDSIRSTQFGLIIEPVNNVDSVAAIKKYFEGKEVVNANASSLDINIEKKVVTIWFDGSPSSSKFDIRLMLFLLKFRSEKTVTYQIIENLNNMLTSPKLDVKGIQEAIINLGGEQFLVPENGHGTNN